MFTLTFYMVIPITLTSNNIYITSLTCNYVCIRNKERRGEERGGEERRGEERRGEERRGEERR